MSSDNTQVQQCRGPIHCRVGPMFSGKSTWLNQELTELADLGLKVLKISHSDDHRPSVHASDEAGSTHSSSYKRLSPKIVPLKVPDLMHADAQVQEYDVIGIDEGQFYPDLLKYVVKWSESDYKPIYVAGLDGTHERKPMGDILAVCSVADTFQKFQAKCRKCIERGISEHHVAQNFTDAIFSMKITGSRSITEVGGADMYQSVCYGHYRPFS